MKIYTLTRKQLLPISAERAWEFFSNPHNLKKITPPEMGFHIRYQSGENTMYAGQLIRYSLQLIPFFSIQWVTEITHVREPHYFVDEQRFGPYTFWHHQHFFRDVEGGVEMIDEVNYAIPFGPIGKLAARLFVMEKVSAIFDYRYRILNKYFTTQHTN